MEKRTDEAAGVEPSTGAGAGSMARIGAESTTGVGAGLTTEAGAGSTTGTVDTGTANETSVRAASSGRWAPEPEGAFRPFLLVRR